MNEDEWVAILRDLHNHHQLNCKKKGKK